MDPFPQALSEIHQSSLELANSLGVSLGCASYILYLRSRSRWSLALEKELIRLHSLGQAPTSNW